MCIYIFSCVNLIPNVHLYSEERKFKQVSDYSYKIQYQSHVELGDNTEYVHRLCIAISELSHCSGIDSNTEY